MHLIPTDPLLLDSVNQTNRRRRPGGVTVLAWKLGKSLVWNCACSDTFAPSYKTLAAYEAGGVASVAEERKKIKYANLPTDKYIFRGLAFESSGVFSKDSMKTTTDTDRLLF